MKKLCKILLGIIAIGGVAAGIFYFLKRRPIEELDSIFSEDLENDGADTEETFSLDEDLEPASEREYVSLSSANGNSATVSINE